MWAFESFLKSDNYACHSNKFIVNRLRSTCSGDLKFKSWTEIPIGNLREVVKEFLCSELLTLFLNSNSFALISRTKCFDEKSFKWKENNWNSVRKYGQSWRWLCFVWLRNQRLYPCCFSILWTWLDSLQLQFFVSFVFVCFYFISVFLKLALFTATMSALSVKQSSQYLTVVRLSSDPTAFHNKRKTCNWICEK